MGKLIVYGKHLVIDSGTVLQSGAVYIEDGIVVESGPYAQIIRGRENIETLGGDEFLVIPGLVNAHGHGKGITDFQRGAKDNTLEVWKFRGFPPVDIRLDTLFQTVLLLESGVTTTMHNHFPGSPDAAGEFSGILEAYKESGMGAAFAPALSYRNPFVYGDNEAFLAALPPAVRKTADAVAAAGKRFTPELYFKAVTELGAAYDSALLRVHHGPMSPQWVEEDVFTEIKQRAESEGRMLFTHVQQTPQQRRYGLETYGKTLIARLAEKKLLGHGTVLGHCVWIDENDIALMAESGCSVTHHPSCNLRVRNGIAPVAAMAEAGITVGIGMDDKEFSDNRDYLEEMRMASLLHRVSDHSPGSPCLEANDIFRMATEGGARCLGLQDTAGALRPGMRADLVLLDWNAMSSPYTWEGHDPVEVLVHRGRKQHVQSVIVNGEVLLRDKVHVRLDKTEIVRKLQESVPSDYAARMEDSACRLAPLKEAVRTWFLDRETGRDSGPKEPFYHLNDRKQGS